MFRYYVKMCVKIIVDFLMSLLGFQVQGHSLVALVAHYCSFNYRSLLRVVGRKFEAMMITRLSQTFLIQSHDKYVILTLS